MSNSSQNKKEMTQEEKEERIGDLARALPIMLCIIDRLRYHGEDCDRWIRLRKKRTLELNELRGL